ncbi:hypothetical protein H0H81_008329 [Sphagnurus paluster]|uniref:F-box domain-containing protein n=1 Tax=Sphagnurus paluster TaxID=117069 RepID=A0A9P7GQ97_9AGAR|nr:hypothetical protein H0H81_008329 [Sphagnurus paluster]
MDVQHSEPYEEFLQEAQEQLSGLEISSIEVPKEIPKTINDFPPEVLGEILEHVVSNSTYLCSKAISTPMILAQVSSTWRAIVFSNPRIWNSIVVDCGNWQNMNQITEAAQRHLSNSRSLPISIHAIGFLPDGDPGPSNHYMIQNLLSPYISRIRHLSLAFPSGWLSTFLQHDIDGSEIQSLESVNLVYHPTGRSRGVTTNNIFANAPRLRSFEMRYASPWCWQISGTMLNLPWRQLKEAHFINVIIAPQDVASILQQCTQLETCSLTVQKDSPFEEIPFFPHTDTAVYSIRSLTIHAPKSYQFDRYLGRIRFPSLEHLRITFVNFPDGHVGKKWSQEQFTNLINRSHCQLRVLSTSAEVSHQDIEAILGNVPSLVELDVLAGEPISASTVRLMCHGLLAPNLEVIKCAVSPDMLSDFLDMLDCRYVPRKSRAIYRGVRSALISCSKRTEGYNQVRERIIEFRSGGRDVTVVG